MHGTCLASRRLQRLAQADVGTNEDDNDYWFHTGYATNFSMDPYNWLVIQLRSQILLLLEAAPHFLTLAAGERDYLETRANIEVFVSPDKWDLGGEHCHAFSKKHDKLAAFRPSPPQQSFGVGLCTLNASTAWWTRPTASGSEKFDHTPATLCLDASERMTADQAGVADCVNQQVFVRQLNRSMRVPISAGTPSMDGPDQLNIDYSIRSIIIQDSPSESSAAPESGKSTKFSWNSDLPLRMPSRCPSIRASLGFLTVFDLGALESAWLASLSPESSYWVMNSSVMVRCTAMQKLKADTKHGFYQGRFDLHRRIQLLRFDSATQSARTKLHRIPALGASDTAQTTTATSAGTQCSCFSHRLQQTSSAPCNAQQLPEHGTVDSGTYDEPLVYIN
uniref:Fmp27_GFWDK domain-containing protein n=1 Tax=Macrostomum lignano TaxID=282301 RepID=A0A1I8F2D2_9PLAT